MPEGLPSERRKSSCELGRTVKIWPSPFGNRSSRLINGAHIVIYSRDPEADRIFFRDVLKFSSVDASHGWLIFAMPPLEAAFHDSDKNDHHELYLCAMTSRRP